MSAQRTTRDGPFCWQSKNALRRINAHFAESGKVASARSIYLAFSEIASNEQSSRFQVKIDTLAQTAGVSGRTVRDVLPEFELLSLLKLEQQIIAGSRLKVPSFYTVLPMGNNLPLIGNSFPSIGNGPKQASVAENLKNLEKNSEKKNTEEAPASPAANAIVFSSEVIEGIYREFPRREGKKPASEAIGRALLNLQKRGERDPADWLLSQVRRYAELCRLEGKKKQHIKMPQGWFNDARYDDDLTPPTVSEPAFIPWLLTPKKKSPESAKPTRWNSICPAAASN